MMDNKRQQKRMAGVRIKQGYNWQHAEQQREPFLLTHAYVAKVDVKLFCSRSLT
jgi:hypothetical protein